VSRNLRNVAIILVLAAAVALLPAAGIAAGVIGWLVGTIFLFGLAWFASTLYRQYRTDLFGLEDRMRMVLYGSLGVAFVTLAATNRMWDTAAGSIAWIGLLGAAGYGLYTAFRSYRAY